MSEKVKTNDDNFSWEEYFTLFRVGRRLRKEGKSKEEIAEILGTDLNKSLIET